MRKQMSCDHFIMVSEALTLRMASCILWKCVALWKWLAISLASSVDSTFTNVNRVRHAIACTGNSKNQLDRHTPSACLAIRDEFQV